VVERLPAGASVTCALKEVMAVCEESFAPNMPIGVCEFETADGLARKHGIYALIFLKDANLK
jgi:hypothetical protein